MARWRQLVAETSGKIAAISRDIAEINRSICENNARSKEYLDYQRTRYIRGEQDWISRTEGGTVYRSDSWGLQNLTSERSLVTSASRLTKYLARQRSAVSSTRSSEASRHIRS